MYLHTQQSPQPSNSVSQRRTQMGIGNECFNEAAVCLQMYYKNIESLAVHSDTTTCPTYIATVSGREPFLLQFRPRTDQHLLIGAERQDFVRQHLGGNLVPFMKLVDEYVEISGIQYRLYEQSIVPGEPFSNIWANDELFKLPKAAEEIARVLAKCMIPDSTSHEYFDSWHAPARNKLYAACRTTDPLLEPFIDDFKEIEKAVEEGVLDELPLAIRNSFVTPLNFFVTKEGNVSGIINWQPYYCEIRPLGSELHAINWIKSRYAGDHFEDIESTSEIESRFWKAFYSSIPREIAAKRNALQWAMKLGVFLKNVSNGKCRSPDVIHTFRAELDYVIPPYEA
ncbi:hypothetical protein SCHPADRAFT_997237 [Schizopora paradoxa]|uniref:Aminoglycoside phosphotransferase domain-containing protein n=1 Tax=Schizopora paradoxa TaxID=27342 RepID=A0A0H2S9P8_9AGAM|nr:hypothetical protein SCHPADRAFT_997237 [Schizopora paradoxa]